MAAVASNGRDPFLNRKEDRRAVVYAVLVHVALLAVVVLGVRWQAKPQVQVRPIQAKVVTDAATRAEVEQRKRIDRQREEQAARDKRAREVQAKRDAEEKRQKEQLRRAEQKRLAEEKRQAAVDKKRKAEQQKKEKVERQKAALESMKEQLAVEERERAEARQRAEQAAREQSELARYETLIRQRVERSWVRPAGWSRGMECIVRVRLLPTGEVIAATVIRSSGSVAFDRSVENAVYKAAPLPLPEDKSLFDHFRELELRFKPEGQG